MKYEIKSKFSNKVFKYDTEGLTPEMITELTTVMEREAKIEDLRIFLSSFVKDPKEVIVLSTILVDVVDFDLLSKKQ